MGPEGNLQQPVEQSHGTHLGESWAVGKPYADKHHPRVLTPPLGNGWGTRPDGLVRTHPQTSKALHQGEGWRPPESHTLLQVRAPHVTLRTLLGHCWWSGYYHVTPSGVREAQAEEPRREAQPAPGLCGRGQASDAARQWDTQVQLRAHRGSPLSTGQVLRVERGQTMLR